MKYNDDGTIKEIKVKSFDTLPVGAELDYDGTTVPSGWTEIENVLWENPNPNSNMPNNTIINLSNDDYDILEIFYKEVVN